MIVPSIDLMGGSTVQLVGGREKALDAGDPLPLAERFGRVGEVAVIDLDAALGRGENAELIRGLLGTARCRVGGGIRSADAAIGWLDAGASKVILGTAARREVLEQLPRDRVIAALDADHGEIVVEGWRTRTGETVPQRMRELRDVVGGFLVTFVEREGRLGGIDMERVRELRDAAGDAALTVAGGVTTAAEIAELDAMGVDAQVGMAIYTGRLGLGESVAAGLSSDRADGLWPTVVTDESGVALGLAYSNLQSLSRAIDTGRGVYWSRKRGLWEKGAASGMRQELVRVDVDCDRDCLRFVVRQSGSGFCHRGTRTCWGDATGLRGLEARLAMRKHEPEPGSYVARLFRDPSLLASKLVEEAGELGEASTREHSIAEAADLLFFAMTTMASRGIAMADVERELDRRALRVTRRRGDAKPVGGDAR